MLHRLGVRGVQLDEVLSLDVSEVAGSAPFGLFFLFKWDKTKGRAPAAPAAGAGAASSSGGGVFFARQTISNACGTLAMLHVLLNIPAGARAAAGVELGAALTEYGAFTAELPPDLRGDLLASCDAIRTTHNLFARPEPFGADDDDRPARGKKADAYHFVAYAPVAGTVYELDGLKPAPVALGAVPLPAAAAAAAAGGGGGGVAAAAAWLRVALPEILRRIAEYSTDELSFCVLALVRDKQAATAAALAAAVGRARALHAACEAARPGALAGAPAPDALAAALAAAVPGFAAAPPPPPSGEPAPAAAAAAADADAAAAAYAATLVEIDELRAAYRAEADTREAQRIENERRRHNFVPFIMELLKQLARAGALVPQLEGAKARLLAARERARAAGRRDVGE